MIIYLYVKQHLITGLKYFGKTTNRNPYIYSGSGTYWKNHIKKHGKSHIKTIEIWGFDNPELCTEFALNFSYENNIVKSHEWANLILEDGTDGRSSGTPFTDDHRNAISIAMIGIIHPERSVEYKENQRIKSRFNDLEVRKLGIIAAQAEEASSKRIASLKKINHQQGSANSQFGTRWIYSETLRVSRKIQKDEPLPIGWNEGRKIKFK